MMAQRAALLLFLASVLIACSSTGNETTSSGASAGGGGAGTGGAGGSATGGGGNAPNICDELGLPRNDMLTEGGGSSYGDIATDFTVQTLDGPWNLAENWTGCDSYLFINYFAASYGDELWSSSATGLFETSANNVHYFFGAYGAPDQRGATLQQMKGNVDAALAVMTPEDAAWWAPRVHYVTDIPGAIEGSLGALYAGDPNVVFGLGITRQQRFDNTGFLGAYSGGGFSGNLRMAGYLSRYYNFVHDRDAAVMAESDVTVVPMIATQLVTSNNELYTATFPDAATMAGFDTMALDVELSCGPSATDCGEWDYEAYIELCSDSSCTSSHQIGLWITPYSRPGTRRWVIEATPFLSMLQAGGEQTLRFGMLWNMNPNTMNVSFRLQNKGVGTAPRDFVPLYTGGTFNASYNDNKLPINFTPPSSTTKVELAVIVTGHGQDAGNCAEWCNHEHAFTINNSAVHTKSHAGEAGQAYGCAERVDEGVVPGQYGNWAPSRAAWCPGLEVAPWIVDITNDVTIGSQNEISYQGLYNGGTPIGGRIRMSSFLIYSE